MKSTSKIFICSISALVVLACLAGLYLFRDTGNNRNDIDNDSNVIAASTDNDDSNVWEQEFNNCAEFLMSRIEQVDASEYVLPEADERDRLERIEVYSASWLAYMSFVANWVQREGTSTTAREEVYRQATLLMVLIDDNHDASLGYGDLNREYCEFIYDHWGRIDILEAAAWEAEFYNCMGRYAESLKSEKDAQVLRLWGEFVALWAENNEDFERIESGTGLSIWMAHRRRECFRTAALLMIYQMEQNGLDYEFIYDIEADIEELREMQREL